MTAQPGRRLAALGAPPLVGTGRTALGLAFARCGPWRLLACAGGGYQRAAHVQGDGWRLLDEDEVIPQEIFAALLAALQG